MCIENSEVIVLKNSLQHTANGATQLLSACRLYKQTNKQTN
jgi:hypothetical protein